MMFVFSKKALIYKFGLEGLPCSMQGCCVCTKGK
jgi:hypothetical protein